MTRKQALPWFQVSAFSLVSLLVSGGLVFLLSSPLKGFVWISLSVLGVGVFLIGASLMLASLTAFFAQKFQTLLHFRKQLGVIGFVYLLLFTVGIGLGIDNLSLWLETYQNTVLTWIGALVFFFLCTFISRASMIKKLGPNRWRRMLRLFSYTGFALVLIAFYNVYCVVCIRGNAVPQGVESVIAFFLFGVFVLILRVLFMIYNLGFPKSRE